MNYNINYKRIISSLEKNGFTYLPTIKNIVKSLNIYEIFISEFKNNTYIENSKAQRILLEALRLDKFFDELFDHGKSLDLSIKRNDTYFISRFVKSGQISEGFRGHFDSHFITIVLPIMIPKGTDKEKNGDLFIVPKARSNSSNEIINVLQKIYWKKFNKEKYFLEFEKKSLGFNSNFKDYRPLVFYGNRSFHGNWPLISTGGDRLTFLCHLFDTSPRFGVSAFMRFLRNR